MITRRQSLKRLLGVGAATLAAPMINRGSFQLFAESTTKYSARAIYKSSYAFRDKMDTDGVNHYKRMFDITDGLIRRGYSDTDIELILGGNFRRVLGQIWSA
jgi:microsomal dipeptidase-like Zn-dependent dipeptidase